MRSLVDSGPRRCRWWRAAVPALTLALFAGCVHQTANGQETDYRYEFWAPLGVGLAGLVAAPAGWYLRPRIWKLGWLLLVMGPILFFLVMPSMLSDRVNVNERGFHVRTGFFGSTAWDVEFDQVNAVRMITETSGGRRRRTNHYLLFEMKAGQPVKVSLGNELVKAAAGEILRHVMERGVPVSDGG